MTSQQDDPGTVVGSLAELAAIIAVVRGEEKRRYTDVAHRLERRGATAAADLFRRLADEVAQGAEGAIDLSVLPAAVTQPWEDLAGSTLLTPYRALAQAVTAAQATFTYASYLAARTPDPTVRRAAERLAEEQLRHAAELRQLRRDAWRREREHRPPPVRTCAELARAAAPMLAEAAAIHAALADTAAAAGEPERADRLRRMAAAEAQEAGEVGPAAPLPSLPSDLGPEQRRERALVPLERLFELFEAAAAQAPDEALLAAAQTGLATITERLRQLTT